MLYVTQAHYIDYYKLHIVFNNEVTGIVDLQEVILNDHRPIFQELADINKFQQFSVNADTITWSNGLDLAPEFLYQKLQPSSIQ